MTCCSHFIFFFFNDTATTEIYTLSLHDALPIFAPLHAVENDPGGMDGHVGEGRRDPQRHGARGIGARDPLRQPRQDRKSTRLNSSHGYISYAVFCLKKK